MTKDKNQHKKGFTLVEFFIYALILSGLLSSLVLVGNNILQARQKVMILDKLEHSGRVSLDVVGQAIRSAEEIAIPSSPGEEGGILSLALVEGGTVFFYEEDDSFIMERGGEKTEIISDTVRVGEVVFKNLSYNEEVPATIQFFVSLEYKNPLGREEYQIVKSFQTTENVRIFLPE